jgi:hypothetical protein
MLRCAGVVRMTGLLDLHWLDQRQSQGHQVPAGRVCQIRGNRDFDIRTAFQELLIHRIGLAASAPYLAIWIAQKRRTASR